MTLTVLQIATEALEDIGIDPPSTLVSGDFGRQMLGIINSTGRDMLRRGNWEELKVEASFTTVATELQFTVSAQFPYMHGIIPHTSWNRTQERPVIGPLTPQVWQRAKSEIDTFVYPTFRIYGDKYYLLDPTAGESVYFEYIDKRVFTAADGSTLKLRATADDDLTRLDCHAMTLGARWRFLQRKGLEYGEHFREYEDYVYEMLGQNLPRETLNMRPGSRRGGLGHAEWPTLIDGLDWDTTY